MNDMNDNQRMIIRLFHKRASYFLVLLAIVDALLIISWFRTGSPIDYAEDGLGYAIWGFSSPNLYPVSWSLVRGAGSLVPFAPTSFIWSWEQAGLSLLALGNPVVKEALTFFFIIYLQGTFTYLLTKEIVGEKTLAPIIAALAYILSPYIMIYPWKRFLMPEILFSALFPIVAYLYYRGITTRKTLIYSSLIAIATFLFGFSFGMPPLVLTLWVFLFLMALFSLILGYDASSTIKMFALSFVLFIMTGAYWILPYIGSLKVATTLASAQYLYNQLMQGIPPFFGIRLILPTSPEIASYNIVYLWGSYYSSMPIIISTFLIPIVAFSSLVFQRRREVFLMAIIAIIGLFLIFGTSPPTGSLYIFLVKHVWLIRLWGNGVMEDAGYIAALPYAVLFGIGAASLAEYIHRKFRKHGTQVAAIFLGTLVILDLVLLPIPMWTGAVFTDIYGPTHSPFKLYPVARAQIPQYYQQANEYLSSNTEGYYRILVLPFVNYGNGITYNLSGTPYAGGSRWALFPSTISIYASDLGEPLDQLSTQLAYALFQNTSMVLPLLQIMGVKYVAVVPTIPPQYSEVCNAILNGSGVKIPTSLTEPIINASVPTSLSVGNPLSTRSVLVSNPIPLDGSGPVWSLKTFSIVSNYGINMTTAAGEGGGAEIPLVAPYYSNWSGYSYLEFHAQSNTSGTVVAQLWSGSGLTQFQFQFSPGTTTYFLPSASGGLVPLVVKGGDSVFVPLSIVPERSNMSHLVIGFVSPHPAYFYVYNLSVGNPLSTRSVLVSNPIPLDGSGPVWSLKTFSIVSNYGINMTTAAGEGGGAEIPLVAPYYSNWSGYSYLEFHAQSNTSGTVVAQLWSGSGLTQFQFQFSPGTTTYFLPSASGGLVPLVVKGGDSVFVPLSIVPERSNMSHLVIGFVSPHPAYFYVYNLSVGNPLSTRSVLAGVPGISYVRSFGLIRVYMVEDPLPEVFVSTKVETCYNSSQLMNLLEGGADPHSVLFANYTYTGSWGRSPNVTYYETPLGYYVVQVHNATGPFILAFDQDYDGSWELAAGNLNPFQQMLSHSAYPHFPVDCYMNGWLISSGANGIYTIYNISNDFGILGELISLFSVIFLIFLLLRGDTISKSLRRQGDSHEA